MNFKDNPGNLRDPGIEESYSETKFYTIENKNLV